MSAEATGWVWRHSPYKGPHAKFLIHLAVADVVNDAHGNEFWMGQTALAEKVGTTRKSVCEWFADATERGLVECVRDNSKRGRPNCYRLVMRQGEGVTSGDRGVQPQVTGGVTSGDTELKGTKEGTKASPATTDEQNEPATAAVSLDATAHRVLEAWVEATGRDPRRVKMNAKRAAAIKARLREGYIEADLVAAARGIGLSAWHMGDNPDGKKFDDLLVAIRDGERVEKFRDLYEQGGERGRRSAVDAVLDLLAGAPEASPPGVLENPRRTLDPYPWGDL